MPTFTEQFFNQPKLRRILYLGKMGFNIPKFLGSIHNNYELKLLKKRLRERKVSIRTQPDSCKKGNLPKELGPHLPNIFLDEKMTKELEKIIKQNYELLAFEAIDPDECLRRGNALIDKKKQKITIEYLDGPGTVRQLESSSVKVFETSIIEALNKGTTGHTLLGVSPEVILDIPFEKFILEFSIYKNPVGEQNKGVVFWEIRDAK